MKTFVLVLLAVLTVSPPMRSPTFTLIRRMAMSVLGLRRRSPLSMFRTALPLLQAWRTECVISKR